MEEKTVTTGGELESLDGAWRINSNSCSSEATESRQKTTNQAMYDEDDSST